MVDKTKRDKNCPSGHDGDPDDPRDKSLDAERMRICEVPQHIRGLHDGRPREYHGPRHEKDWDL